jgi:hypothetical protein
VEAVNYLEQIPLAKDRKAASDLYAQAIRSEFSAHYDWAAINRAIVRRWSRSGLIWIKNRAWKIAQGKAVKP